PVSPRAPKPPGSPRPPGPPGSPPEPKPPEWPQAAGPPAWLPAPGPPAWPRVRRRLARRPYARASPVRPVRPAAGARLPSSRRSPSVSRLPDSICRDRGGAADPVSPAADVHLVVPVRERRQAGGGVLVAHGAGTSVPVVRIETPLDDHGGG